VTLEDETLERDFGFRVVTVWPLLCDGTLARDRHAQFNRLLSALDVTAQFLPAVV